MRLCIVLLCGLVLAAQDTAPRVHRPVMRVTVPAPLLHSEIEVDVPVSARDLGALGKLLSSAAQKQAAVCAVPLLRADPVSPLSNYSMKFAPIQGDHSWSGSIAQPPAPPCAPKDYLNK